MAWRTAVAEPAMLVSAVSWVLSLAATMVFCA